MPPKGKGKLTFDGGPSGICVLIFEFENMTFYYSYTPYVKVFLFIGFGGQSEKMKADRTRRSWTKREEEVLVIALHDLVAGGWKADNGFRLGYATRVHQVMKREIPNLQLKVSPHINSKIHTWKREYQTLSLILDRSGVGFNANNDFKIECNDEQWAQIVKVHKILCANIPS